MLSKIKNTAINSALKIGINEAIKEYGYVSNISLDKENKKFSLTVNLIGEKEPLTVDVNKYTLVSKDDGGELCIQEIDTSRLWLTKILNTFIVNQNKFIPSEQYLVINKFF